MHLFAKRPAAPGGLALSLAALGLAALAAPSARAQTQDLFVSNIDTNTVSRFAGTGVGTFATTSTALLGLKAPEGLAFDARGDLFAATYGNFGTKSSSGYLVEFAAGATPGSLGAAKVVGFGLNSAFGVAVDAGGDVFVADNFSTITKFAAGAAPGTLGAVTTFTDASLLQVTGLAFDVKGDLFVASEDTNTITEFAAGAAPGTFGAVTVLSDPSLYGPSGLAVDARGDLFAADNSGGGSGQGAVTEFVSGTAGAFGMGKVIETGLNSPSFLTFGPSASPVPEASTTVSLGLLLALGLGGLAVARKRRGKA